MRNCTHWRQTLRVDVAYLPSQLSAEQLADHTVVVFDVLRATTSMVSALANGTSEIRVFDSIESAQSVARGFAGAKLLCGESQCVRPEGFDLGNSPADYSPQRVLGK